MAGFVSGFEFVRRLFIPSDGRVSFRNLSTDKISLFRLFRMRRNSLRYCTLLVLLIWPATGWTHSDAYYFYDGGGSRSGALSVAWDGCQADAARHGPCEDAGTFYSTQCIGLPSSDGNAQRVASQEPYVSNYYWYIGCINSLVQETKNFGSPRRPGQCGIGNPCNPATGNKYQTEEDYRSADGSLSYVRSYNSQSNQGMGLGFKWVSPLHKRLEISGSAVQIRRPDGYGEPFICPSSGTCQGDSDTKLQLTKDTSGYTLSLRDNTTERYDLNGRIVSQKDTSGRTTSYAYDTNGGLYTVTVPLGYTLAFKGER